MDAIDRLQILSSQMSLEPAEEVAPRLAMATAISGFGLAAPGGPDLVQRQTANIRPLPCGATPAVSDLPVKKNSYGIHLAAMPGGRQMRLMKTLLTSACERDCYYCPFRTRRNFHRATLKPEEMADLFTKIHHRGEAEGLFLSSGIAGGGLRTQDRIIATAEILRLKLGYRGYLHLKIMPGAERAQIERTMQLADRVSINLEAPNDRSLQQIAPHKQFAQELVRPLHWVEEIRRTQPAYQTWSGRWPSSVTQFVVGGADETDVEILSTTERLYRTAHLARTYYSAFNPVLDTPLENRPAESPLREFRLYQASFLLRDYDFTLEDMSFTPSGNLPLEVDPKVAWAQAHLNESPIEINRADRRELLRVPGIGPKAAEAILTARRTSRLHDLRDLRTLGIGVSCAAPFILLDGKRPPWQMSLW